MKGTIWKLEIKKLYDALQKSNRKLKIVLTYSDNHQRDMNLYPGIVILNYVNIKELPTLISGAKSLFYVSGTYRGIGMPIFESMSCGTPVMISNRFWDFKYPDGPIYIDIQNETSFLDAINVLYNNEIMEIKKKLILKEAEYYGLNSNHSWNEMADDFVHHLLFGDKRGNECNFIK
jgi:glycosyltransferase involved in cell wall biosynthesis